MTTARRRALVPGLAVAAIVCSVLALVLWRQPATTATGALCGSVWHNRPGHGGPSGGQHDAGELIAATQTCQQAAAPLFVAGVLLLVLAGVAVVAALVVVSRGSDRRPVQASRA